MSKIPRSFLIIFPTLIFFFMLAVIFFALSSPDTSTAHNLNPTLTWKEQKRLLSEGAQYSPIKNNGTADTSLPQVETRKLSQFFSRRAYNGAPPIIPHPVNNPNGLGEGDCLACHEKGGYAQSFKAWVPKTPHPQWKYCRQCHALPTSEDRFVPSNWVQFSQLRKSQPALKGSPPPIPHEIQYRENCSSCHTGAGALKEIRTTHPERVQCRQCHALQSPLDPPDFVSVFQPEGNIP